MCTLTGCGRDKDLPDIVVDEDERRLFLKGLACLPLATVLAHADLAQAAAGQLQTVSVQIDDNETLSAALALPDRDNAPAVLLIHEWWGLNDQIKAVAAELANLGYIALAVDLYGGEVANTPEGAMSLMKAVNADKASQALSRWIAWLQSHEKASGKVATMGWCFGGGWSLAASVATPVDATIIYYGRVDQSADALKNLNGPVLAHFARLDKHINAQMVSGFEAAMRTAEKHNSLTLHWYDADHAFANPTGARYDAEDAASAWQRTTQFLEKHLG
ncbi:MAG TPA: dienelactone hydrolase [Gammaproteobacteria bacterium]|jgi:carboxymethylenebutenolidase|nr:dienelactone hydrolase [Gammaproteobacteria bacterium]